MPHRRIRSRQHMILVRRARQERNTFFPSAALTNGRELPGRVANSIKTAHWFLCECLCFDIFTLFYPQVV